MTPVELLMSKLPDAKRNGKGWQARCPAHDDRRPSLSIAEGDDGRALVKCHAGCTAEAIMAAVDLTLADLMPPKSNGATKHNGGQQTHIVEAYAYRDESGALLFEVVRRSDKSFPQRMPDGKGGWTWNLDALDQKRPLYHLSGLSAADRDSFIFLPEGEKDVHNIERGGGIATTCAGGASKSNQRPKWPLTDLTPLYGRHVVLLPDNDKAGRAHMHGIAEELHGKAASVRVLDLAEYWPELPVKGDVSDWLDAGGDVEELIRLTEQTLEWELAELESTGSGPVLVCLADVEAKEIAWLWPGRIPLGRITLLVGRPGEGKSFVTTDMAARVTTGTPWPDGSACPAGSVILVSAEDDPGDTIRPRLDAHHADVRKVHLLSAVRRMGDDGKPVEVMFTLADVASLEAALKVNPDCRLIVVDPIGSFMGGKTDAHRDNEVRSVLAPVAKLAERYGPAVLVVAHRRKSAGSMADDLALGSRAFTGIARAVWHLTRDSDNKARRLLLPGKNNLAPEGNGLAFTITGEPAAVAWEREPVAMSADDALAAENGDGGDGKPGPEPEARSQAVQWLRELLEAGPMESTKIKNEGKEAGYAWRTLHRAKDELDIRPYREQFAGNWWWKLPGSLAGLPCHASDE